MAEITWYSGAQRLWHTGAWGLMMWLHPITSPSTNQRIVHEPIPCPEMQNALLKSTGEFKLFEHWSEVKWKLLSHVQLLLPHGLHPARLLGPWDSPGKNTGVGCHSRLQGIFPNQGSNPSLLHCRQILYRLSHFTVWATKEVLSTSCPELPTWHPATNASLSFPTTWCLETGFTVTGKRTQVWFGNNREEIIFGGPTPTN